MLQLEGGPLQHFHTCDIVPVCSLHSNETNPNGTYKEPTNLRALESEFAPTTLGGFVGNPAYAALTGWIPMGAYHHGPTPWSNARRNP